MSINERYTRYVSQNILGMLGLSFYILADTYFISRAEGAGGITALNLVLPVFGLINGLGAMTGVGSAICYTIRKAVEDKNADLYFSGAVFSVLLISIPFVLGGLLFPSQILAFLGGDETIRATGTSYIRTIMTFTPLFMTNAVVNAFVRNDRDPSLAMAATLISSLFNIAFDYILMFPMKLGMLGAGIATGCSPAVGILICCAHFFKESNTLKFVRGFPSVRRFLYACRVGVSALIGELSSGITTAVFNILILRLAGNTGVAAYGIIANIALVSTSVFNGVSQGAQPLISESYGKGDVRSAVYVLSKSFFTVVILSAAILACIHGFTGPIVEIFNCEHSAELAAYADKGAKLYFLGFLFAGINIAGCGYLSATEQAVSAFACSLSRGVVTIVLCAVIMSGLFGMTGIWLSFLTSEIITSVLMIILMFRTLSSLFVTDRKRAYK